MSCHWKISINSALAGLIALSAISFATTSQNPAQAQDVVCEQIPASERADCEKAYDLLTRGAGATSVPAVLGTGIGGNWQYTYELPARAGAGQPLSCISDGALTLARQDEASVSFTAQDTIYEWNVPSLNAEVTAIPGRVEVIAIKAGQSGTFAGQSRSNGASTEIEVRILDEAEYEAWLQETAAVCSH